MGIENFLHFIEEHCPSAYVPVDLLKITQTVGLRMPRRLVANPLVPFNPQCLCLVIDGECCLDRLYGGYFNDWSCGGQWSRMFQFLHILISTIRSNNIMVVVYFNGALEMGRFKEWTSDQLEKRGKIKQIMRHIRHKGTPPPKVLWVPPVGLRSALRMALRHFMIPVLQSVHDHKQEVMSFLREHDFDAVVGEGAEYAFFDPPRFFSAERLKLTFRGSLESRELILDEVAKLLNLHPIRFCLLAAMLGNFMVTDQELRGFYDELLASTSVENKNDYKVIVPAVVAFIRNLTTIDDLLAIGNFIFRNETDDAARNERSARFVRSVQYFMNGTKEGYQKFFSTNALRPSTPPSDASASTLDHQVFASEAAGGELHDVKGVPKTKLHPSSDVRGLQEQMKRMGMEEKNEGEARTTNGKFENGGSLGSSSASSTENLSSSKPAPHTTPHSAAVFAARSEMKKQNDGPRHQPNVHRHTVPPVPVEVIRTNAQRHQKGLMHPWIHNVLSKAEMKLEVAIEEGSGMDFPPGWMIFRPVRQSVYAILFNLNHKNFLLRQQREGTNPEPAVGSRMTGVSSGGQEPGKYPSDLSTRIFIKEWVYYSKHNTYQFPDFVPAVALDWRGVPTVQRLWFGQNPDDKKKRLKAFLNCLASDSGLMLNQTNVPQHLLLMACVLRYMCAYPDRNLLTKGELDAFLAQALSPQLSDPNSMQDMTFQIRSLSPRGVQLAQIFMQGVEHALFANDACGAPIPWVMCCPWQFFDGKLFQTKLDLVDKKNRMQEMCGKDAELVKKVESLRSAVLEGLEMIFNKPRHPPFHPMFQFGGPPHHMPGFVGPRGDMGPYLGFNAGRMGPGPLGGRALMRGGPFGPMPTGLGGGRRELFSRGGQLEVAGVVVGSWGGNVDKNKFTAFGRGTPLIRPLGAGAPFGGPGSIASAFGGPTGFNGSCGLFGRPGGGARGGRFGPMPTRNDRSGFMFHPQFGGPNRMDGGGMYPSSLGGFRGGGRPIPSLREMAFGMMGGGNGGNYGFGGPRGNMMGPFGRPNGFGSFDHGYPFAGRGGGGRGGFISLRGRSRSIPRRRGLDGVGFVGGASATAEDVDVIKRAEEEGMYEEVDELRRHSAEPNDDDAGLDGASDEEGGSRGHAV